MGGKEGIVITMYYGPGEIGKTPIATSMPKPILSWDEYKDATKRLGINNFSIRFKSWEEFYKEVEKIEKITKENK